MCINIVCNKMVCNNIVCNNIVCNFFSRSFNFLGDQPISRATNKCFEKRKKCNSLVNIMKLGKEEISFGNQGPFLRGVTYISVESKMYSD